MPLPARISGGAMNESWEEARARCEAALGELVEGKSEAFKERWSRSDLTVIMGAFGGYERGWNTWHSDSTGQARESERWVAGPRTYLPSSAKISHARLTWNTWSAPSMGVPTIGSFAVPRCTGWRAASGR